MNHSSGDDKEKVLELLEEAYSIRVSDLKTSLALAEKALSISRKLDDKLLEAKSLSSISLYCMIMADYKRSTGLAESAITLFEELGDERGLAQAKYNIASVYYKTDNYHLGLVHLIDCRTIYQKHNDYHNLSRVEKSIGTIYEYFGDQKNAIHAYEEAITAAVKAGDLNLESNAYNPLSGVYLKQHNPITAKELISRAIAMKQQTGDIRGLAFSIYGRAKVYLFSGDYAEAENDFLTAIDMHIKMGESLGLGMAYHKLGGLYIKLNRFDDAKAILARGLEVSNKHKIAIIKFKCYYLLYVIDKQEGNINSALEYLEHYLKEKEAVINTQTLKIIENYELITKMKWLENEAKVQRERAEIIEKKNRAEEAARVKQDFLSTMSHEIRTPLNAVITISGLLNQKSNKEEQELLDSLKFAANNLLLIINDILDFTKLDSGKVQLEKRPVNFEKLLKNLRGTYYNLAKVKKIELALSVNPDVHSAYEFDETKLAQILGNLISNAIKFTEHGAVTISVEKINGDRTYDTLRFAIKDTGVGIPKNSLDEVFESFSQPKSITTRKHGGTGLGLAIVKKLVALHDSDVLVESEVGKGSCFYFDLLLKKTAIPIEPPKTISIELKGKKVLLAEDNKVNAMVAMKLLSNWGMVTVHAENGLEAVDKACDQRFDYILMDIHMPEMNGFDATKYIKQGKNPNTKTPVFALTADVTAEYEEGYTHYFSGFLRKPIELDKLYEALVTAALADSSI
jgi:signal transduction histidine kinase/ActR/RegA family two-component response regulator